MSDPVNAPEERPSAAGDGSHAGGPEAVDLLITGADIVSFDDANRCIANGAIAVKGNVIAWMGDASDAAVRYTAKETLRADGLIAMPGFTDTHVHTEQQFLRGIGLRKPTRQKGPLWKGYLAQFENVLEPEDVYASGLAAYTSMISSGTTCFLEAGGTHPDEMGRAADEVGIRGRLALAKCDIDGPGGPLPKSRKATTSEIIKMNEALVARWKHHPRVNAWLCLQQLLVNSEELRIDMWHLAEQLDTTIHTHLSEGTYEIDFARENWNLRPPAYLEKLGIFDKRLHCAHAAYLMPFEVDMFATHDVSVGHCPCRNYYLAPHRYYDMVRQGVRAGLGTDGPIERGTMDMFQVMHYAVMGTNIGYGMPYHAPSGPIRYEQMLRHALRGGADAAGLGRETGSLEVGKLADIVLTARDDFDQYPSIDATVTLAEMTTGMNVRTVIVDGRVVMKNREFLTVDLEPARRRMQSRYKVIMERFEAAIA